MDWTKILASTKQNPQFDDLMSKLNIEYQNQAVYPSRKNVFRAFEKCHLDNLKVVILGQDPYHGPGQAMGLSFSVPVDVKAPPSLVNIFKELKSDLGVVRTNPDLSDWAEQGVLLLNSSLTVRAHHANSHSQIGWQWFSDQVLKSINQNKSKIVYILWGSFAQKKAFFLNPQDNHLIKSAHPSPLSAYNGFFGSQPFSKTNNYLISEGIEPIKWG